MERETKKGPARTCVGCGASSAPEALVRLVLGPEGEIAVDMVGGSFGRGAHVHGAPACLTKACKGGLARAFKAPVTLTADALATMLVEAAERRAGGLLGGALRAGQLAVGADMAREALGPEGQGAALVVVAADAGSIARSVEVQGAVARGRAVVFGSKARLGGLLGRDEVALCAVRDEGLALAIKRVFLMADSVRGHARGPSGDEPSGQAEV